MMKKEANAGAYFRFVPKTLGVVRVRVMDGFSKI